MRRKRRKSRGRTGEELKEKNLEGAKRGGVEN